jgi:hypothetical protein
MSSSSHDARLRLRNESRKQQKFLPREYRTKLRQLCEITQTDPKTFARSTKGGDPKVTCDREKSDTVMARCRTCSKNELWAPAALLRNITGRRQNITPMLPGTMGKRLEAGHHEESRLPRSHRSRARHSRERTCGRGNGRSLRGAWQKIVRRCICPMKGRNSLAELCNL